MPGPINVSAAIEAAAGQFGVSSTSDFFGGRGCRGIPTLYASGTYRERPKRHGPFRRGLCDRCCRQYAAQAVMRGARDEAIHFSFS